ncbi:trypsin-like peptidase domain-containing protein [Streptomyces sp. NPDC048281]|uniref:trypsin-like peptidase domain-containing protein n=1 Tax=Streptomyces sp. NPDC048281 TaxID=3154715 RepID=UPI00343DE177
MDRRRLALVLCGDTGPEFREVGTGYLVAPRLVLTARHVVERTRAASWPRIQVRVGHPRDGAQRRCEASVSWTHPDGSRDVALLLLADPVEVPGAVRWGRPVGDEPLRYLALGFPLATTANERYGVEPMRGELPVLGGGAGDLDRYVLDLDRAPDMRADGKKAWGGASGSAVFCEDHLVGVVIHADVAFGNRRLHACPGPSFVDDSEFADLVEYHGGGRPRLSQVGTELERYLRAAFKAATKLHPYPEVVPDAVPPLSDVYVRQQVLRQRPPEVALRSLADSRRQRSPVDAQAEDTEPLSAETQPAGSPPQPADEVLTGEGICLVVGEPGVGKSSLLRICLADGAEQGLYASDEYSPVPVLVPAVALQDSVPIGKALVDAVNSQLSEYGLTAPLPDFFFSVRPGPGRRWLVLVDGLDEITSARGRKAVLNTVANAVDDYAFIVATRPLLERELQLLGLEVPRYQLQPFKPDTLTEVAAGWFRALNVTEPEQSARRFLRELGAARLTDLARVPLWMSLLCQLWAETPGRPLPRGRGEVHRQYVELLHERHYTAGAVNQAKAAMEQYGSDAMDKAEQIVYGLQKILADLAYQWLRAPHERQPVLHIVQQHQGAERPTMVPEQRWRDFLQAVLCGTGLLTRRSGDLVFAHKTCVEYLAARHVVDDEERLRVVFRDTFIHPVRHIPGRPLSPGIKPRRWFSTYWKPPGPDLFDGFLLDITPDDHPLKNDFLRTMTSQRAGLAGYLFLAEQVRQATSLPEGVVENTVRLLRLAAHDRSLDAKARLEATRALVRFERTGCAEIFRELAYDRALDGASRMSAAVKLGELAPAERMGLFRDLAQDMGLDSSSLGEAMRATAALDPVGGIELLLTLVRDRFLDNGIRVLAALVLADVEPAAATEHLRALARDGSVSSFDRLVTARRLQALEPAEGAEVLRSLAQDGSVDGFCRVWATKSLSDISPAAAADLQAQLACDPTVDAADRLDAAKWLLLRDPQRALTALRDLRSDTTLRRKHRRRAAALLSDTRLRTLADDTSSLSRAAAASR